MLATDIQNYLTAAQRVLGVQLHLTEPPSRYETPPILRPLLPEAALHEGELYFGDLSCEDFPSVLLHEIALHRNTQVIQMARDYADLVGSRQRLFDDSSAAIALGIARPKLDADMQSDSSLMKYLHPYTASLANAAGLPNCSNDGITYKATSFISAFLVPTLEVYQRYYENAEFEDLAKHQTTSRDYDTWKRFILGHKTLATRFFSAPITAHLTLTDLQRHAYIVGGTGSGKSELMKLLAWHILRENKKEKQGHISMLILDPHGDFVREVARFRDCEDNSRIIYFDPRHSDTQSPSLDIFALPDQREETIDICAANLAGAFDEIVADSSLSSQMKTLLIPCISVLLRREGSSLHDLQRFMLDEQNDDLVSLGKHSPNPAQANFFRYGFHDRVYTPTKRALYTRIQTLLNARSFARMVNPRATFDLEEALNSGKMVLMNLAHDAIGRDVSSAFGRLVIALVKNIALRRQAIAKQERPHSYVFLDECQNFVGESLEESLVGLRKFGVHLILANQVIGQDMSTQLTHIILGNTAVKFVGASGNHTRSVMAKELGVKSEELATLAQGNFCGLVSTGKTARNPFFFRTPSYLVGNRYAMSPESWKKQLQRGWEGYVPHHILDGENFRQPQETPADKVSSSTDSPKFNL